MEFKDLFLNISEEEYRNLPAYSYSLLSKFARTGFYQLDKLREKESSPSLSFGTALDSLMFGGEEEFNTKVVVKDITLPSDNIKNIIDRLNKDFPECGTLYDINPEDIQNCAKSFDYYKDSKFDNLRLKNIYEKGYSYFESLKENRCIISSKDYEDVLNCRKRLLESDNTAFLFNKNPFDDENEIYYQLKGNTEMSIGLEGNKTISIKGMFDIVKVNHKYKTVSIYDLKTTSKPIDMFVESYLKYRYYIQAEMYKTIMEDVLFLNNQYHDYKFDNFHFIVINRTQNPVIFYNNYDFIRPYKLYYCNNNVYKIDDWRKLLSTLNYYDTEHPSVPLSIEDGYSDIYFQYLTPLSD